MPYSVNRVCTHRASNARPRIALRTDESDPEVFKCRHHGSEVGGGD